MLSDELIQMLECAIDHNCATKRSKRCATCELAFKLIAEEPLQLTCGDVICKKCKNDEKVACKSHGETTVGLESKATKHIIEINKNQLFEMTKEKFNKANNLLKETEVKFENDLRGKIKELKNKIDMRVENLKYKLDQMREELCEKLDQKEKTILNDSQKSKSTDSQKDFESLKDYLEMNKSPDLKELYSYQQKLEEAIKEIKNFYNSTYEIRFDASTETLKNDIIGELSIFISNEKNDIKIEDSDLQQKSSKIEYKTYDDGQYAGELDNGLRHGKGHFFYTNGDVYDGDWKNDKPHGYGIYYYKKNEERKRERYEGEFKDGKMEGKCTLYWTFGEKYVGEFANDKRNGMGKIFFANPPISGDIYDGHWVNNKVDGYGAYYFKDGSIYKGNWSTLVKFSEIISLI